MEGGDNRGKTASKDQVLDKWNYTKWTYLWRPPSNKLL